MEGLVSELDWIGSLYALPLPVIFGLPELIDNERNAIREPHCSDAARKREKITVAKIGKNHHCGRCAVLSTAVA